MTFHVVAIDALAPRQAALALRASDAGSGSRSSRKAGSNKGSFDFDFQWPTRLAREPKSARFVVDGIRLGVYVLDTSGTRIAENVT